MPGVIDDVVNEPSSPQPKNVIDSVVSEGQDASSDTPLSERALAGTSSIPPTSESKAEFPSLAGKASGAPVNPASASRSDSGMEAARKYGQAQGLEIPEISGWQKNVTEALSETAAENVPRSVGDVLKFLTQGDRESLPAEIKRLYGGVNDFIKGKPLDEISRNFPEAQARVEAEKTPALSKERFKVGFQTLVKAAMAAGGVKAGLSESAAALKPTPESADVAAPKATGLKAPPPKNIQPVFDKYGLISHGETEMGHWFTDPVTKSTGTFDPGISAEDFASHIESQRAKFQPVGGDVNANEGEKASNQGQRGQGQEEAQVAEPGVATPPNPKVTGISQAMHEERGSGVKPGEGATPEEMINRGRQLLQAGANPETITAKISKGEGINADETAVLRAHIENLSRESDRTRDAADANPNDPRLQETADHAFNAETSWRERIKPAGTEWQKVGATMQGATDVDTGSFTGIRRAVQAEHGRDLTPKEVPRAKQLSRDISQADKEIKQTRDKLYESVDQMMLNLGDEPSFKGRNPEEVKAIWEHAKRQYIDKGDASFDEMIHGTAQDLGLTAEQVRDVIAGPKGAKGMTTKMYELMSKRRAATQQAQAWIKGLNDPKIVKIWNALTRAPFSVAVAGHVVGMETHAGAQKFNPSGWKTYWSNVGKQWQLFGSPAAHEQLMQAIEKHPNYYFWKRAGAAIDPKIAYDPYQQYARWGMGKLGEAGSRAMDILKWHRLEKLESDWDSTPSNLKTGDYAKELARMENHATGAAETQALGAARHFMFAAKLFASRWARVIGDPARTVADWTSGNPEKMQIAKLRTRRAAEFGAVYLGSLALNEGLLSAFGSTSHVNFTDPTKPDWLKHKIAGKAVDLTGNLLDPIRFLGAVVAISLGPEPPRGGTRFQAMGDYATRYARGKLNPFFGIVTDIGVRTDFTGRPMPHVPGLPDAKEKPNKPQYTWPEYLLEQRGPIPVSGGIREIVDTWREKGMSNAQIDDYLRALAVFGTEATGVKVSPEPKDYVRTRKTGGGVRKQAIVGGGL